jgi:hypothetical protein
VNFAHSQPSSCLPVFDVSYSHELPETLFRIGLVSISRALVRIHVPIDLCGMLLRGYE